MEFFKIKKDIPFMSYGKITTSISLVTFILAVFFLATRGLNFGLDFTGGAEMEVHYAQSAKLDKLRAQLAGAGMPDAQVKTFGSSQDILVTVPVKKGASAEAVGEKLFNNACLAQAAVSGGSFASVCPQTIRSYCARRPQQPGEDQTKFDQAWQANSGPQYDCSVPVATPDKDAALTLSRNDYVGPQVGKDLADNGLLALLFVSMGIVGYLWLRFEWKFGLAAIIANLHDVVIILGFFAFFQWEFSLTVLAGVLAVLGYSVNESVVVFDRIRENFRKLRKAEVSEIIDNAITRTMSRTIITHACTQMMVTSMLFLGGESLHYFALALTIGILFSIYSSVLVASPLLMMFGVSREDFIKPEKPQAEKVLP
ncbi:MAG TPA: protein translocase subunit SecF [Gallionellaceae bacterium]|nr:protein translocase subunit SecF [Gallionellaceae bacterium]